MNKKIIISIIVALILGVVAFFVVYLQYSQSVESAYIKEFGQENYQVLHSYFLEKENLIRAGNTKGLDSLNQKLTQQERDLRPIYLKFEDEYATSQKQAHPVFYFLFSKFHK